MEFDLPKALASIVEPERKILNEHYRALFPEYDWQPHPNYMNLAKEMCWFYDDVVNRRDPRWLSALGHSGTGKSEWAKRLRCKLSEKNMHVQMWNWTTICDQYLNNRKYDILYQLEKMPILIIDEIGQSTWRTGIEKLSYLLERRMDKWTVCISNLTQGDMAEKLDVRIASRLNRKNNRIATMMEDCPDYCQLMKKCDE